jgi:hypothetical protein
MQLQWTKGYPAADTLYTGISKGDRQQEQGRAPDDRPRP